MNRYTRITKAALCLTLCALFCLSLAACGAVVDLDTPKSAELKEQYDFYEKSVANIRTGMGLTPEQSDEVFIALVSVGASAEIRTVRKVSGKDGTYALDWSGAVGSREVDISDGVVVEIRQGANVIYPLERATDTLNAQAVEGVAALIEGLTADSSRSDYEAAQSAYDSLSGSLKKQIADNLVASLSDFNLSTMTIAAAVDSAIEAARADVESVKINENKEKEDGEIILIYLKGKDNFTVNMIRDGMLLQARDILAYLHGRNDISEICIFWSLPLTDAYGNTTESNVMKLALEKDSLQRINFDNFDWNNFPDIADSYYEHAALSD